MWPAQAPWTPVTTKLLPPSRRSGLVSRVHLESQIEAHLGCRLLLLSAPAGYGKTSSLAQVFIWLRGEGRRVGWVSLEKDDNDLFRFLAYVVETLRRTDARHGALTDALLASGSNPPADALRAALLNDLAGMEEDFYLFLDDFHLIAERSITELIEAILLASLPKIHLLIATRGQNELPVTRLRMLGQVFEIHSTELAFSNDETGELFRAAGGPAITADQIDLIRRKTEGWPASLQMAAIAVQDQPNPGAFLERFSGTDRSISDFLVEEVLARQPTDIQHFLLATSIFKRFSCALCNAVLDRRDSRRQIDRLESLNLFIFSLDRDRNWYRYHHLFSELLRKRLSDRHPDLIARYHRRACDWLAENQLSVEAIDHAFAVNDYPRAGELLDTVTTEFYSTGQHATLHALAQKLPRDVLRAQPRLQLELAWEHIERWEFDDARAALDGVRGILDQYSDGLQSRLSDREVTELRTQLGHREAMLKVFMDEQGLAIEAIRVWLAERQTRDIIMVGSMTTAMMMCRRLRFEADLSRAKWETLRRQFTDAGAVYATVFVDAVSGDTFLMRGELDTAEQVLIKGRRTAIEMHGEHSELTAMPSDVLVQLYYERNELDKARELLKGAETRSPEFGVLDHAIARFVTALRLAHVAGDPHEAEIIQETAESIADRFGFKRLQAHLLGERVRTLANNGAIVEAAAMLKDRKYRRWFESIAPSRNADTVELCLAIAHCRTVTEAGDVADAVSALKRWLHLLRERKCRAPALRIALLLAKLSVRSGDAAAARRYTLEALNWGEAGGFIRSFVDEGPSVGSLVRDVADLAPESRSVSNNYLQKLMDAFGPMPDHEAVRQVSGTPSVGEAGQPPSAREIEIMKLSAESMATKEIARTLGLTEGTVKWYWKRIFGKLGVNRRLLAIRVARQRGLIS